jgi:hypothetical protein
MILAEDVNSTLQELAARASILGSCSSSQQPSTLACLEEDESSPVAEVKGAVRQGKR